jgi:hypothetical protein
MPGLLHAQRTPNRRLPEICQKTPSVVVEHPTWHPGWLGLHELLSNADDNY